MASQPGDKTPNGNGKRSFREMIGLELVDLYVGPERAHYRIHKEALCDKVPYFEKMFKGGFKEATSQSADFPEDCSESFDLLLGWVYSDNLPPIFVESEDDGTFYGSWSAHKFYALAEKLCLHGLQNSIMDKLLSYYRKSRLMPSTSTICMMYDLSPAKSPMRRFAATAFHWITRPTDAAKEDWPLQGLHNAMMQYPDLTFDFLELLRTTTEPKCPYELDFCTFHIHDDGKSCSRSRQK
ncbi:hypothetical protein V8E51_015748 [Hyaloscypha variabilis]